MIPDRDFLTVGQVFNIIKEAVEHNKPLSLVRVGDGENFILAQNSVRTMQELLKTKWVNYANNGHKGVTLPNLKLRDEMVESIKKADIVGIPFWNNDPILAGQSDKRPLTEAVFSYFNIKPKRICHTFVNRVLTQRSDFWNLLKGKRILLIGEWANRARTILKREPYGLNIDLTISFTHYDQMGETIKAVIDYKDEFDIALAACGVNAVVLSQKIAELTEKVAIDFGKSLMFIVQKRAGLKYSSHQASLNMLP